MSVTSEPIDILIRRLKRSSGLDETELAPLRSLPVTLREFGRSETISYEGDRVDQCLLVVQGSLARFQDTREGKRQILSFYVPGDIPDLQTLQLPTMDHNVGSMTPAVLAGIPHKSLLDLCASNQKLANALWRETLIDASITRTWLRCVGRLSAHGRIAHILCELYARLSVVGLAKEPIRLPMTQQELADATGLSAVRVNQILRELREDGLITVQRREMTVNDWPKLQHVAEFNPLYLHLDPGQRR